MDADLSLLVEDWEAWSTGRLHDEAGRVRTPRPLNDSSYVPVLVDGNQVGAVAVLWDVPAFTVFGWFDLADGLGAETIYDSLSQAVLAVAAPYLEASNPDSEIF